MRLSAKGGGVKSFKSFFAPPPLYFQALSTFQFSKSVYLQRVTAKGF
jgi:hypothetical protein